MSTTPDSQPHHTDRFNQLNSKLTKRARKALTLAQDEARQLGHDYLGTEHVLLGLVAEGEGVATIALRSLGAELSSVRSAVEHIVGRGDRQDVPGDVDMTPRALTATALAVDEARRLGHKFVGTEHLLLGLIREGDGMAAGVLQSLGVTLEQTRDAVLRALAGPIAEPTVSKSNVITCRIDGRDLDAIDALVEVGIRSTRSDAAAWLIHAGIDANRGLLEKVYGTVAEIRRLREEVSRSLAGNVASPRQDDPA